MHANDAQQSFEVHVMPGELAVEGHFVEHREIHRSRDIAWSADQP